MSPVYVAALDEYDSQRVQVCDSRLAAMQWLASTITEGEWVQFYDSLSEAERGTATRDRSGMSDAEVLSFYAGQNDDGTWGADMYVMTIYEQDVYRYHARTD